VGPPGSLHCVAASSATPFRDPAKNVGPFGPSCAFRYVSASSLAPLHALLNGEAAGAAQGVSDYSLFRPLLVLLAR